MQLTEGIRKLLHFLRYRHRIDYATHALWMIGWYNCHICIRKYNEGASK